MTNPPPPFQVPDGNDPDDNGQQYAPPQGQQPGQFGPPQGDPQAFTPPYGVPSPHAPQQQQAWSPPQDQQQWQPPQQDQAWQPPAPQQGQWQPPAAQQDQQWQPPPPQQGQQWQPPAPQQDQQWAPPPPAQQQFGPPQGVEQPPYVPPQSSAPQSSPQQSFGDPQSPPQWSSDAGFAAPPMAAAGAGAASAPFPPGGPTGFDSGPGSGMPMGHRSGPGHGGGGFPPPAAYGPPARPQDVHLGPPRHRPQKHKRSVRLPVLLGAVLVAGVAIPAAAKQAEKEVGASSAGEPLAKAEVAWSIREGRDGPATPAAKIGEEKLNRTGVWYTDTTVVIAEARRLAAYKLDTGALAWEYASSAGEFVCDVDMQGDAKQAIVAFGGQDDCSTLEGIDITAGKKMWSTPTEKEKSDSDIPDLGSFGGYNMSKGIVVSGGVAVYEDVAYQTSDGRKLWSAESALGEDCSTSSGGFTGGAKLVVMASCGGGLDSASTVAELDPMTGRAKWTYDVPPAGTFGTVTVVSTDPVAVMKTQTSMNIKNPPPPELTFLDDQGREAFKVGDLHAVVAPRGSAEAATGAVPILSTDKVVYVPSSDMSGFFGSGRDVANQLTAYDRATGQKLWTQNVASGSQTFKFKYQGSVFPIRVEESGDVLVLVQDGGIANLRPMNLVRVSAKDGSMTNLKELPKRVTVAMGLMSGVLVHEKDGRVYLAGYPKGPNPLLDDLPIKNALGQAVHYDMSSYRLIVMQ